MIQEEEQKSELDMSEKFSDEESKRQMSKKSIFTEEEGNFSVHSKEKGLQNKRREKVVVSNGGGINALLRGLKEQKKRTSAD